MLSQPFFAKITYLSEVVLPIQFISEIGLCLFSLPCFDFRFDYLLGNAVHLSVNWVNFKVLIYVDLQHLNLLF